MMNRNLYFKELRRSRKNFLIWGSIVLGFTLMILSLYPSMASMGDELAILMNSLPEEFTKAFGMDANTWSNVNGYYSTYYGIYIILLMSIYSASTAANIITKEARDGTAEFLYTRPISRASLVQTKVAALGTLMLGIFALQTGLAMSGFEVVGQGNADWEAIRIMHLHGFFLLLLFTSIGFLIASFLNPKMNFMGMIVGMVFGTYFLNAISQVSDKAEWLGYISPFNYLSFTFDPGQAEAGWLAISCFVAISIACIAWGMHRYRTADIS